MSFWFQRIAKTGSMAANSNSLMNIFTTLCAGLVLFGALPLRAAEAKPDPLAWPALTSEAKPWTRWWWLGSAVDTTNLTRELTQFQQAGLGGVEICPIYGAKGAEGRFVEYLSPRWMEMLAHASAEAQRLGLGLDMTTGTGWPFGGPNVTPALASSKFAATDFAVAGGAKFSGKIASGKGAELQCLTAVSEDGKPIDLTDKVDAGGRLDWTAPTGKWQIFALSQTGPLQKVKRSAPG